MTCVNALLQASAFPLLSNTSQIGQSKCVNALLQASAFPQSIGEFYYKHTVQC